MEKLIKHINKTIIAPYLGAKDSSNNEIHYKAVLYNRADVETEETSSFLDTYNGESVVCFAIPATEIDKFHSGDRVGLSIYNESHNEVWCNMYVYDVFDMRVKHTASKETGNASLG